MRPVSLHLENFGPYQNEKVNFDQLRNAKLFLITGRTGSGKTTLFDAMTFALYGDGVSDDRSIDSMRSDFANPHQPTKITFTFTHQNRTYQIMRRPKQILARQNGVGSKTSPAKGRLKIFQNGQQIDEITKLRDISIKIDDLLHLSRQQFIQIVLLPQGDFRRFLMGSSNDKESILRKIFKTQLYQKWGKSLHEQLRLQQGQIDQHQTTIDTNLKQFSWSKKPQNWDNLNTDEKLAQLKKHQEQVYQHQQQSKKQLKQLQDQLMKQQNQFNNAQNQNQQIERLNQLRDQAQSLKERQPDYDHIHQLIQDLTWAQQQSSSYEQLQSWRQERTLIESKLEQHRSQLVQKRKQQNELDAHQHSLKQQTPIFDSYKQQSLELKQQRHKFIQREDIQSTLDKVCKRVKSIQQQQQRLIKALKRSQHQFDHANQLIDQQSAVNQQLNYQIQLSEKLTVAQNSWHELQQNVEAVAHIKAQRHQLKLDADQVASLYRIEFKKYQTLHQQQLKNQIAELVSQLEPGQPCPVCGSLKHPKLANEALTPDVNLQAVETQNQYQQTLKIKLSKLENQLTTTLNDQRQREKLIENKTKQLAQRLNVKVVALIKLGQILHDQQQQNQTQLKTAQQRQKQIDNAQNQAKQIKHKITTIQEELNPINLKYQDQFQKMTTYQIQLDASKDIISAQIKNVNDLDNYKHQIDQKLDQYAHELEVSQDMVNQNQSQLASVEATIEAYQDQKITLDNQIKELHQKLIKSIQKHCQTNQLAALEKLLSKLDQLSKYQNQWQAYQDQLKANRAQISSYQELVGEAKLIDTEQLVQKLQQLTTNLETKEQAYDQVQRKLTINDGLLQQIYEHQAKINQSQATINQMLLLDQTVNGSGDGKLSLERYVLRTRLEDILSAADLHFHTLSSGRYSFQLHHDAGSYRKNTGLEIDVYDDHVGKTRSVHTLSGGESFIASLSLALALGEVIQQRSGGITIDTLFIDEGFGSLDRESLIVVMQTLENIESNSRTIGIISHVRLLAESIPSQIRIKTDGQGHSHTQIVVP